MLQRAAAAAPEMAAGRRPALRRRLRIVPRRAATPSPRGPPSATPPARRAARGDIDRPAGGSAMPSPRAPSRAMRRVTSRAGPPAPAPRLVSAHHRPSPCIVSPFVVLSTAPPPATRPAGNARPAYHLFKLLFILFAVLGGAMVALALSVFIGWRLLPAKSVPASTLLAFESATASSSANRLHLSTAWPRAMPADADRHRGARLGRPRDRVRACCCGSAPARSASAQVQEAARGDPRLPRAQQVGLLLRRGFRRGRQRHAALPTSRRLATRYGSALGRGRPDRVHARDAVRQGHARQARHPCRDGSSRGLQGRGEHPHQRRHAGAAAREHAAAGRFLAGPITADIGEGPQDGGSESRAGRPRPVSWPRRGWR